MYTLKDLVSGKFSLLNESDLLQVEGINAVSILVVAGERKKVKVHIGLFDYLFASTLKEAIKVKVKNDLGSDFDLSFGI
jgi:hypothetical protein